jgi:serpin B
MTLHAPYARSSPARVGIAMTRTILSLALLASITPAFAAPATHPFAGALDAEVARHQTGNFVISPTSISLALAMARDGARGTTQAEFDRVLGSSSDAGKALLKQLASQTDKDGPTLVIANRLYGDLGTQFDPAYLDLTAKDYGARLEALDFRNKAEAARQHINDWIAQITHDKIKDLLSPGSITKATRLVLADAVYLKAAWAEPFKSVLTAPGAFTVAGGSAEQVPMMHGDLGATWGEHDGARMIDLPYRSSSGLGMLVVVPTTGSLTTVEAAYDREGLAPFVAALKTSGLAGVSMPRFEIGTKLSLEQTLEAMGLKLPFGTDADFSGMSKLEKLAISSVVHQAWIKVDEAGTEAAAATGVVVIGMTAMQPKPVTPFAVDRSFLFFVHDAAGNVLFGGRVTDPSTR